MMVVRDTRVVLGLLENVIAGSVEIDKGNVLTVAFPGFALAEMESLMKCSTFLSLLAEECGKDVRPALHVRKRAKTVLTLESHFVVVFVRPVKVYDLAPFASSTSATF
jgi:hypothetical protein